MVKKSKQEKQRKKKSWKPIFDRKRTSPGTGRSNRSGDSSDGSVNRSDGSVFNSASSSLNSSSSDERAENCLQILSTSTPRCDKKSSPKQKTCSPEFTEEKENKINRMKRNPKGRPDMSKYSPVKLLRSYTKMPAMKRSNSNVAMESESGDDGDAGVSPKKKLMAALYNRD